MPLRLLVKQLKDRGIVVRGMRRVSGDELPNCCFLHPPREPGWPDGNIGGYSQINDGREKHEGPGNHSTQLASAGFVTLFIRAN